MKRLGPTFGLFAAGVVVMATGVVLVSAPLPSVDAALAPEPAALFAPFGGHYRPQAMELRARNVPQLKAAFERVGYKWDPAPERVPRVRLTAFPPDMDEMRDVRERKRIFFQVMLPLILIENERILADRERMLGLFARMDAGTPLDEDDGLWLRDLAKRYKVAAEPTSATGRERLARRVNAVPQSLALAMAANESGWGTSRFVEQGNNLFGHWTYTPGAGLVPKNRPEGLNHEVAVFPDLASSVRAYLRNLNTNWAHLAFRQAREVLPSLSAPDASIALALTLTRYSERGVAYTQDLVKLIRRNRLARFDETTLEASTPLILASAP